VVIYVLTIVLFSCPGAASVEWQWHCVAAELGCKSAFVVHSSWHAAIVLRRDDLSADAVPEISDFPEVQFVEFSWGDKDYFPNPEAGFFSALNAAFWSGGSVLHVVGFNGEPMSFYPGAEIIELRLSAPAFSRLQDYLSETFSRPRGQRRAQASAGLFVKSHFYPATGRFSLMRTCNTWVAEAFESAGLPISPSYVITAGQLAEQIDKVKKSE
jgi:uncharacterized protein (TIGR02117 family)